MTAGRRPASSAAWGSSWAMNASNASDATRHRPPTRRAGSVPLAIQRWTVRVDVPSRLATSLGLSSSAIVSRLSHMARSGQGPVRASSSRRERRRTPRCGRSGFGGDLGRSASASATGVGDRIERPPDERQHERPSRRTRTRTAPSTRTAAPGGRRRSRRSTSRRRRPAWYTLVDATEQRGGHRPLADGRRGRPPDGRVDRRTAASSRRPRSTDVVAARIRWVTVSSNRPARIRVARENRRSRRG